MSRQSYYNDLSICRRKKKYPTTAHAFMAFVKIASNGEWHWGFQVYQCPYCNRFHIGHKRGSKRKGRRTIEEKKNARKFMKAVLKLIARRQRNKDWLGERGI